MARVMTGTNTTVPAVRINATTTADGRTMIGHVVVCQARDDSGQDMIAIWQVSTTGLNTGAWIVPASTVHTDPAAARRLLERCLQRSVTGWDPPAAITLLATLERTAELAPGDWPTSAIALPDMLTEIGEIRSTFEKRVAAERQTRKNIIPLEWDVDLPDPIPPAADELRKFARLGQPSAPPAAQEALLLSNLVRWCVRRWQETLTILTRRDYLAPSLAHLGTRTPRWESHVSDAYALLRSLRAR